MNSQHFNVVTGAVFSGKNLEAVKASTKEHGYKTNQWISFGSIKALDAFDGASLKGRGVRCMAFPEGKPVGYSVFNVEEVPALGDFEPAKPKAAPKRAKKAPKKAAKAAPKKRVAKKATKAAFQSIAIPVQGEENVFLMSQENGTYLRVTL